MKRLITTLSLVTFTIVGCSFGGVLQHHSEKALWIETREHGHLKTMLAVTEPIARMVAESKETTVTFSPDSNDLVTKQMILDVLDGRERSMTRKDAELDQEVTMYLKDLEVPGREEGRSTLVLQTYKEGKKTFSITLPDIEVESKSDDGSGNLITRSFGWKALLPFLAKKGGALYVKDVKDDSEVWLFVE